MNKLVLCVAFMFGCFNPDLVKAMFKCDTTGRGCPQGLFCLIPPETTVGTCVDPAKLNDPTTDLSGTVVIVDLYQPPPIDMGGSVDMRIPPDLSTPPSTCKAGGGIHIGDGIYACQGTWTYGGASALCTNKVCTMLTATQKNNCDTNNGFYFISAGGSIDNTGNIYECLTFTPGRTAIFYGCGKAGLISASMCNGSQEYIQCSPTSNFNCTVDVTNIASTVSSGPQRGVLCCP